LLGVALLLSEISKSQVVILQQGFDSSAGSHSNGTWTNVSQIQNGGNTWTNQGSGNDIIEGNKSCSGWSTCNDKTGNTYGITGGAPNFNGTGTNIGYSGSNSTYFAIFDDYDASNGSYGGIYTPTFNLSNYHSSTLTFYWNNANTSSSYIQVQYWNGSSWTGTTNFGTGTGSLGWHQASMSLPSTATQVVIFVVSDFYYYAIGIDQIEIYGTPNCTLSASIGSPTNVSPCSTSTNGAATVTPSSGTTPYTYSWTPSSGITGATTASASTMAEGTYTCTVTDHNGCVVTPTVTIGGPAAVTGSISSQTNVACSGGSTGSATISASGGTSPYTYSWTSGKGTNTTASSLSAGSYTCTITDAHSCTGIVVVTITQPSQLRDSISAHTNVLCNGSSTGSATVGVKGGTSPYTYLWSPSGGTNATANNLAAGSYTVTVTDHNSCTATATVSITQPSSALTVTIGSEANASCNGEDGSATVTANGGTSPYTYSWSSGAGTTSSVSLTAGSYTVTVTDHNSCTATATVTITQPAVFQGYITPYSTCGSNNTGAVGVDLSGGTQPYTYSWSPNVSTADSAYGLSAGNYTVTVNDANGCGPLSGYVTVTTLTAETVSITSSTNINCYGQNTGSATASASPTHAYVWAPGGSTNATISSLAAGTYTVTSTETDGCIATATVSITQPTSALLASMGSPTNVSPCSTSNNGTASVTASGGTSPYTYSWTPSTGLTGATTASASAMKEGSYTCSVTDAKGCTATATVTISGPTAVTGSVSSQTNVLCYGASIGSATISASGGTSPYTYSWTSGKGTNATASGLSAGSYTCTITDAHSCTGTVVVTITQPNQLRDSISAHTNVLCNGTTTGSATVGVKGGTSPYAYSWSPSGGTNATANNLAAGSYTITVTDHNSCTVTATVTITQPAYALRDSISSQTNVLCNGEDNGSATIGAKYGTTPYTYFWSSGGGNHATANNLTAGTYTCTVTDNNGCTATAIATITQPAEFGGYINTYNICGTGTGEIGVDLTGGTPPYTYSWTPNITTADSASGLASGTSYTITVNDANGCGPLQGFTNISIITAETVTITSSSNVSCYGGSNGSATASASPTHAYVWSPGGSTNASISSLSTGTYTVVATETDGCTSTATVNITQPTIISPTITFTNTCSGFNNGIATVSVSGGVSPYTYNWTPSGGTNATASNLAAGNYTVTVTDHNSCSKTATVTIGTNATPTISITPASASICTGSSAALTASGATTYSWSPSTALNVITGATVSANPTSTITYSVTGTTNGCPSTTTIVVTVNPLPTLTITPSSVAICTGSSNSLTASGASRYTWAPISSLNTSSGATVSASPTVTTTYTATGTNSNGCINTQTVVVTVNPLPTLTITPSSAAICSGSSISLTASGASTYTWSPGASLNISTGATVSASPTVATTYTVTGTNSNGCVNTQIATITINPLPTLTITPSSASIDTGSSILLTASGANTYIWSPSAGLVNTTGDTVTASPANSTTYTVSGTNTSTGCTGTQIEVVTVDPVYIAASADTAYPNSPVLLMAGGAGPGGTYTWGPAAGLNATTGNSVLASPLTTTTYTVTGTSIIGVINTTTMVIHVVPNFPYISSPTPTICLSNPTVTVSLTANPGGAYSYSWLSSSGGGLNSTTGRTVTASPTVPGTYTYTVNAYKYVVLVNGGNGLLSHSPVHPFNPNIQLWYTATFTVMVLPQPTIIVPSSPQVECTGYPVTLTASLPSAYGPNTYTWSPTVVYNSTDGSNVSVTPTANTVYTTTLTTAPPGCAATNSVIVDVVPVEYATLQKELDGNYYLVQCGNLYFKYDEEYVSNTNALSYNIYDYTHTSLASTTIGPDNYKDNYYYINLASLNPAIRNGFFILEVINKKGEKTYLRFEN